MSVPKSNLDRNMPILVVDDLPMMRRVVKNCLRQLGFENVVEAENGDEALDKLQSSAFSFVISDWTIPTASGNELLKTVRHCAALKNLPVLMVLPETQRGHAPVQNGQDHTDFIVKPFTAHLLQEKMESLLK